MPELSSALLGRWTIIARPGVRFPQTQQAKRFLPFDAVLKSLGA
jgi:hypothetical protein